MTDKKPTKVITLISDDNGNLVEAKTPKRLEDLSKGESLNEEDQGFTRLRALEMAMYMDYTIFPGEEFDAREIKSMTGKNYDYGCWLDGIAFLVAVERNLEGNIEKASLEIYNFPYTVFKSERASEDFVELGRYAERTASQQKSDPAQ